jgi:hypothetical protein
VKRHFKKNEQNICKRKKKRLLKINRGRIQPTKRSLKTCKKKKKSLNIDMRRKARKQNLEKERKC